MDAVAAVVGVVLVLAVLVDVPFTVLAPSSRGPISHWIHRGCWYAARRPVRGREGLLRAAGPVSVLVTIVVWLGLLWLGFGLVFWPMVDGLTVADESGTAPLGLADALYFSGTSLTTLGFGELVPGTGALRALSVLEAVGGLSVLTAAVAFMTSLYTLVSELRAGNQATFDLGADDADRAADVVLHRAGVLDDVQRDVVGARQHLLRFPVLYYFHPAVDESPLALLRSALGLCITANWAVDHARVRHAPSTGRALVVALRRLLEEMEVHVRVPGSVDAADCERRAAAQVDAARRAVAARDPDLVADDPVAHEALRFIGEANAMVRAFAGMHAYADDLPLLGTGRERVPAPR